MADDSTAPTVAAAVVGAAILFAALLFSHNPDWNHGGNPTDPHHPSSSIDAAFDPKYIMLLYMDTEDSFGAIQDTLRVRAVRVQFRSVKYGNPAANTWENNQQQIAEVINQLNAGGMPTPAPQSVYVKQGLTDFDFNQPHHVVIYIQNKDVHYNPVYPIWFRDILVEPGPDGKPQKADKNWSFFAAAVKIPMVAGKPAITGNFSKHLIYVKNFYRVKGLGPYYSNISTRQSYALQINALVRLTDTAGNDADTSGKASANILPITIDPDTGNMGGGEPT
ncbi:MAG: hypothetical protein ABWX67_15290 [Allosphingosinicella sp.]